MSWLRCEPRKKSFLQRLSVSFRGGEWIKLIRPCYYKGERGNKPYDLERMLRIYMIQNLYNLSDMATVAEVIDSRAFSDFCGIESTAVNLRQHCFFRHWESLVTR